MYTCPLASLLGPIGPLITITITITACWAPLITHHIVTFSHSRHILTTFCLLRSLLGPIGPLITHHILKSVRKAALRKKAKAAAAEKKD